MLSKQKIIVYLIVFLLLVIGVEFAVIYLFEVDATILQSLKYIIPIAIAVSLILTVIPKKKTKSTKKRRKPQ